MSRRLMVPAATFLAVVFVAAAALSVVRWAGPRSGAEEVRATLSATAALAGSDTAGYSRATEPRPLVFPDDHGPHPGYRTEWWYFTGNLADPEGRRFGYQLTFFRNALAPESAGRESAWDTNQLWMAHFALTDAAAGRHRHAERFARGAVGLAGGEARPFRVWVEGWEARGAAAGTFPLRLRAREEGWAIDLTLEAGKPHVLQGDDGLSRKGPEVGNASYYFSHTRMPTEGRIELDGEAFEVRGASWLDREWSTSALGEEHVGWDWFSLQLSDGREIMFFELRREDGEPDPLDHGILVHPDGSSRALAAGDVELRVTGRWTSPLDGTEYPSGWRLLIPAEGVELEVEPLVRDQEMNLSVRYWEGAVSVRGRGVDGVVEGYGFVELTGYGTESR